MNTTIQVTTQRCLYCGESSQMEVDRDAFNAWREGKLIQDAFPDKSADWREQLMSGSHPACWDAMFAEMLDD